ncbi:unnamed protein product [Oikopleura dioica]|uniref:receptor protein serine/threonine kinase n=1 Tax=Oikopleura dioica TaxID=34765 RepID=E4Y498_OIKDI|nr:unnamed protein product [Oikopleura dioica]
MNIDLPKFFVLFLFFIGKCNALISCHAYRVIHPNSSDTIIANYTDSPQVLENCFQCQRLIRNYRPTNGIPDEKSHRNKNCTQERCHVFMILFDCVDKRPTGMNSSEYAYMKGESSDFCDSGDFCSQHMPMAHIFRHMEIYRANFRRKLFLLAGIFLLVTITVALYLKNRRKKKRQKEINEENLSLAENVQENLSIDESFCSGAEISIDFSEDSLPFLSGSGGGLPALGKETIAQQIKGLEEIGSGLHGSVYRALWHGEFIAVKKFQSWDDESWRHELDIYKTQMISHRNILRVIAAASRDNGTATERWLVTEFHPHGSLYDYLGTHSLKPLQCFKLLNSLICAIEHLHRTIHTRKEIDGCMHTISKIAIVHRDVKSRNILVSNGGECILADFGLSLRLDQWQNQLKNKAEKKIGTTRYMPPEVLGDTLDTSSFENYKKADMYSIALVIWEILSRTLLRGMVNEDLCPYNQPYTRELGNTPDPSIGQMTEVVVCRRQRPIIPHEIVRDPLFKNVAKLSMECWDPKPTNRHSALRMLKSLTELEQMYKNDNKNEK